MKNTFSTIILFTLLLSCGYPDIDNVPEFKDNLLSNDEIADYCSNLHSNKKNIDNCINDNKSKN